MVVNTIYIYMTHAHTHTHIYLMTHAFKLLIAIVKFVKSKLTEMCFLLHINLIL